MLADRRLMRGVGIWVGFIPRLRLCAEMGKWRDLVEGVERVSAKVMTYGFVRCWMEDINERQYSANGDNLVRTTYEDSFAELPRLSQAASQYLTLNALLVALAS